MKWNLKPSLALLRAAKSTSHTAYHNWFPGISSIQSCNNLYILNFSLSRKLSFHSSNNNIGIINCQYIHSNCYSRSTTQSNVLFERWKRLNKNREIKVWKDFHKQSETTKNFEDQLFDILSSDGETVPFSKFLQGLKTIGLRKTDPRLQETIDHVQNLKDEEFEGKEVYFDKETFKKCIKDNILIIRKAFNGEFVIPEFVQFCSMVNQIYWQCRTNNDGHVATYIPQLSRYSPDYWGVSLCTIDGQRYSIGDTEVPFCLQSCSKPLSYALAVDEHGSDAVHNFVGQEPSGHGFNKIKLDYSRKPHNPLINAGAIITTSLVKNNLRLADRFDFASQQFKKLAGGEFLGFNNAVFLSERESADRNFALGYYMKENKCFPDGVNLMETLDFYFQLCSIEVTAESAAVIAASLANGGICPLTGERVLSGTAVRNTLSLMHSCGMYDYSGQFAFKVGLPAKSGVSGATLLVVPNVMGLCLWSPPLDRYGNTVRGIQFCQQLVETFNFHYFDNLQYSQAKMDPRLRTIDKSGPEVVSLLFGAFNGDVTALRRMLLSGVDMGTADYDGRTALHLAASEGHIECVKFLISKCNVPIDPKDRWNRTPHEDAVMFKHNEVINYIEEARQANAEQNGNIQENNLSESKPEE